MDAPGTRLQGASVSGVSRGRSAAPSPEPSGAAPTAPARRSPRPSSARRCSRPLPATASTAASAVWERRCLDMLMCSSLPPIDGAGLQGRRIRGVVGGDSRVRLASGRTAGNATRHGGGPSTMGRPATARLPSQAVRPDVADLRWGRYAPVDHRCQEKVVLLCCRCCQALFTLFFFPLLFLCGAVFYRTHV